VVVLIQSHEQQFNPAGDAELVEHPEQIILDGVLAQFQVFGNLAIGESLGFLKS
jgi:hypothetical protein